MKAIRIHAIPFSRILFLFGMLLPMLFLQQPAMAQSGNVWRVDFFPNLNWTPPAVYSQFNFAANFNWGVGSPGPNVPVDNFTARFTSQPFFYAGLHRFSITADDEFVLIVDGAIVQDTRGRGLSGKNVVTDISLGQGVHNLQIDFREFTGTAYIFVDWWRLGQSAPTIPLPPNQPLPDSAAGVQTRFGDFTPCIQQNLHQVYCFRSDGAWDSPNYGSIEMEPPIVFWGNCTANVIETRRLFTNRDPQSAQCSRTEAGWFAR